ncbi:glycosyltransferase family 4 protein [Rubrivivax benzoatilyticus]|uniref:Glycosyltransferase family 4 protein n=1 Tax=Rubrivivax benzoatilyticus TaxID=316997 RepID=A0ABX0HSC2_9BURK|nr:glycosyltransferase family 4 protein [Rubrivivax benzoatilyticus]NHL23445.1 glycosyltransferase family 4 protein [Rubrivivax benzoatilyticus]
MNVTSSVNWTRPAVGIVRVERALARELAALLGPDRFRLCVWRDGRFVQWLEEAGTSDAREVDAAVDLLLPRVASFDIARPFVLRALRKFAVSSGTAPSHDAIHLKIPASGGESLEPERGDVVISAGLDWDYEYSQRFHEMARERGLRIVSCCYDLIPVLFPQYCVGEVAKRFTEYFIGLCWGSEAVLCISQQTQRDFSQLCRKLGAPDRVTAVIPLGDNVPMAGGETSDAVKAVCKQPFILFVSTIERRKNHEVLYRAYHRLARQGRAADLPQLVFVGMPGWGTGDLLKDIELDPLTRGKITQLHHVTDSELNELYQRAAFCVYPSLYEGWGLPVGEALAMGKAVISSSEGSLPEVGGPLVRYVDAWDVAGWAEAIWQWVSDPEQVRSAERAVRRQYVSRTWAKTAEAVVALIDSLPARPELQTLRPVPGYDMSTHAGVHAGARIEATGTAGLLLFGPHWPLRAGSYRARVHGRRVRPGSETLRLEIASDAGTTRHHQWTQAVTASDVAGELAQAVFRIERDVDDIELRIVVEDGSWLCIDTVEFTPEIDAAPAGTTPGRAATPGPRPQALSAR